MPPPISELLRSRQPRSSSKNDASRDTVLPLHTTSATKGHSTQRVGSPNMSVTNNFLLGGMYVPSKDHRRRRMVRSRHRKYYYAFLDRLVVCPTNDPFRRSFKFIVILFGVVSLHYGIVFYLHMKSDPNDPSSSNRFRRPTYFGNRLENLLQDRTLSKRLLPLPKERSIVQTMHKKRQQQQWSPERLKILEELVPDWFHRNDPKAPTKKQKVTTKEPDPNAIPNPKSDLTNAQRNGPVDKAKEHDTALEFRTAPPKRQARTLLNMEAFANVTASSCPLDLSEDDHSISLVIQSTLDRIWILQETCQRWKSPIILVIAVRPKEPIDSLHVTEWSQSCPQANVILYHLNPETESSPEQYPVNAMRNVALDAVQTSHILLMDVDFVPSDQLDEVILLVLSEQLVPTVDDTETSRNKMAVVVPAFERILSPPCTTAVDCAKHLQRDSSFIPRTFDELKECYDNHDCMVFQKEVNWEGHSSTRTTAWLHKMWYNEDEPTEKQKNKHESLKIRTIPCFDSLRYEPYVVLRWCPAIKKEAKGTNPQAPVAPYYDERFHGYGKNKIQLISHLRMMGYQFHVLPKGFIVHNPHVESASKETWSQRNDEHSLHRNMDVLYQNFLRELVDKYLVADDQPSKIVNACARQDTS